MKNTKTNCDNDTKILAMIENDDKTTFHNFEMTSEGAGNGLIDLYKDLIKDIYNNKEQLQNIYNQAPHSWDFLFYRVIVCKFLLNE